MAYIMDSFMKRIRPPRDERAYLYGIAIPLSLLLFTFLMGPKAWSTERGTMFKRWKGYAILGNGNLCAVHSDDYRIVSQTGLRGIQHCHFNDYTADYIRSTSFEVSIPPLLVLHRVRRRPSGVATGSSITRIVPRPPQENSPLR